MPTRPRHATTMRIACLNPIRLGGFRGSQASRDFNRRRPVIALQKNVIHAGCLSRQWLPTLAEWGSPTYPVIGTMCCHPSIFEENMP